MMSKDLRSSPGRSSCEPLSSRKLWIMPECSPIQTCVCYGRGIQQQGCGQDGCCQIFQSGSHINRQVPETFAQSPLPLETFLRIQTWHTKYPRFDKDYALDFNVWLTSGLQASQGLRSTSALFNCTG